MKTPPVSQLTEEQKELLQQQLAYDRNQMTTYLLSSCISIECMDKLSASPFNWIKHEVKASFNHHDKTFKRVHKQNIEALFNLTDEGKEEGELLIKTQQDVEYIISEFGKILASLPVHLYPQFLEKVMDITFDPIEEEPTDQEQ